jgi:hypothetical protein
MKSPHIELDTRRYEAHLARVFGMGSSPIMSIRDFHSQTWVELQFRPYFMHRISEYAIAPESFETSG